MARIFYRSHDIAQPSGGVAVLYEHVGVLRRAGFDAFILHGRTGFVPSWLTPDVPIVYADDDFRPRPDDVIVIPEDFTDAVRAIAKLDCRRMIFCQNQYYASTALHVLGDWRAFGIEACLASTRTIQVFLHVAGWADAALVPYAIDPLRFRVGVKKRQIAYMPRKRPLDASYITYLFPHRYPDLADWHWVKLDGMHRDQVAEALAETAIFLTLGQHESMGLPALEAMLSGALVSGYHGDGDLGLPEAAGAALWTSTPDAAIDAVGVLARWIGAADQAADFQRAAGMTLASGYSVAARDAALLEFWKTQA